MPVLYYILKLSLGLIIIWLFYQLVLRRLTFYAWNRWYLVVCPTLAFLLPLINISPVLEKNNWIHSRIVTAIPNIANVNTPIIQKPVPVTTLSEQLLGWLPFIIAIGALVMLVRLLFQYYSLVMMRQSSTLLLNGRVKVYQVDQPVIPFSFGNAIFLNQNLHGEEELKEIIRHEFIHVKQRHTFDIIWSEAICILTWYNPFSWLLRKAIRQNLEFIADQHVLKTGLDRKQYQYLLLKVIGAPSFSIASNFNFKSLKKRIAMMNKVKSARVHLVRFALLLPVVAILLVAFRNAAKHRQQSHREIPVADTSAPRKKAFPDNVQSFHSYNNQVTVTLKNGKVEKYNLDNEDELAAYEKKYGRMPEPPPPPAAPDVIFATPVIVKEPTPPSEPVIVTDTAIAGLPTVQQWAISAAFDQDDCYNDKGYCLSLIETRKGPMVMVLHKSKKEAELVYLEDWKKDKKYEEKYGKLPSSPPPPPVPPAPGAVSALDVREFDAIVAKVEGVPAKYDMRVLAGTAIPQNSYSIKPNLHGAPVMAEQLKLEPGEAIAFGGKEIHIYAPGVGISRAPVEEQEIIAVITNKTTFKDLVQLKQELKEKHITLDWLHMKAHDGILNALEGKIQSGTDKCHFQVDDFTKIVIALADKKDGGKGFHIHVTNGTVRTRN